MHRELGVGREQRGIVGQAQVRPPLGGLLQQPVGFGEGLGVGGGAPDRRPVQRPHHRPTPCRLHQPLQRRRELAPVHLGLGVALQDQHRVGAGAVGRGGPQRLDAVDQPRAPLARDHVDGAAHAAQGLGEAVAAADLPDRVGQVGDVARGGCRHRRGDAIVVAGRPSCWSSSCWSSSCWSCRGGRAVVAAPVVVVTGVEVVGPTAAAPGGAVAMLVERRAVAWRTPDSADGAAVTYEATSTLRRLGDQRRAARRHDAGDQEERCRQHPWPGPTHGAGR